MEKPKKDKEVKFNPADYDYMDDLPLAGWIWEFIRRSKDYRAFYEKWEQSTRKPDAEKNADDSRLFEEYLEKYSPIFPKHPDSKRDWPLLLKDAKKTKLQPLLTVNLGMGFGVDAEHGENISWPHPPIQKLEKNFLPGCYIVKEKGAHPLNECDPDDKTTYIVEDYPPLGPEDCATTADGKNLWFQNYPLIDHPIEILYEYQGRLSVIMALIDISTSESIDEILKSLKRELLLWRKVLKLSKTRSAKTLKKNTNKLIKNALIWKSYLIVYDLIAHGKSLEEVSEVLSLSDDFYSDVKNVENHYKSALALISGGYRKYM